MSKIIKLTPQCVDECTREFQESLLSGKFSDGKISFHKILNGITRKAKVYFTDIAWTKMQALIDKFDKEVAWHGVAHRGEDENKDEYYITDILVYPQEVSGASVEMNVDKYEEWIRDNIEDERFFSIGMQGHSHVNMGVTPSSVDISHQETILKQLSDDMFYIFMIWNKKGDKNIKIYDLSKNVLFETGDVEIETLDDEKYSSIATDVVKYCTDMLADNGFEMTAEKFASILKEENNSRIIEPILAYAKDMVKERTYNYCGNTGYNSSGYPMTTYPTSTFSKKYKDEKPRESIKKSGKMKKGKRKKSGVLNDTCDDSQFSLFNDDMAGYPYNDPFYYN